MTTNDKIRLYLKMKIDILEIEIDGKLSILSYMAGLACKAKRESNLLKEYYQDGDDITSRDNLYEEYSPKIKALDKEVKLMIDKLIIAKREFEEFE